ncbi:hypothetical protein Patl1_14705 [Pistacia atlantica]|uniref:Uncharacterized protein n=1 Tax=Pistacia atlantica TaxID=434234 RepID=A0ACC1ATH6_9ROSI|nr:hypothetical protein Patl1_14705 [Pistacia atlantica]
MSYFAGFAFRNTRKVYVECLIKDARPDGIVAYVGVQNKVQCEEIELGDKGDDSDSLFGVIKQCFVDRIDRKVYENAARTWF